MRKVIEVPYIDQSINWPTVCESVSSVMLLQALGFDISVDEFIRDHLPMQPMGEGTGPDPDQYFAGSPYDPDSFGCYPGVIVKALNSYFDKAKSGRPDKCFSAQDATGVPTQQLLEEQIDRGLPVDRPNCVYTKEYLEDDIRLKNSILSNPFEKFERKRFVYYSKDLSMISFNPALWQKLTEEKKEQIREKETRFLEQYYEKYGGM